MVSLPFTKAIKGNSCSLNKILRDILKRISLGRLKNGRYSNKGILTHT